jgi:hypothetical protein
MTQEVQVILTLEVDATQTKAQIKKFTQELVNTHTFHSNSHNRMMFSSVEVTSIKEEAELYGNE